MWTLAAISQETDAGKTDDHHRPGGCLRDRCSEVCCDIENRGAALRIRPGGAIVASRADLAEPEIRDRYTRESERSQTLKQGVADIEDIIAGRIGRLGNIEVENLGVRLIAGRSKRQRETVVHVEVLVSEEGCIVGPGDVAQNCVVGVRRDAVGDVCDGQRAGIESRHIEYIAASGYRTADAVR